MSEESSVLQKRVSLVHAVLACVITLLTSIGGSVAWATQFQTKSDAAATVKAQSAEVQKVKDDSKTLSDHVEGLCADVARIDETTNRLDDKLDKVLLRLSVRR